MEHLPEHSLTRRADDRPALEAGRHCRIRLFFRLFQKKILAPSVGP